MSLTDTANIWDAVRQDTRAGFSPFRGGHAEGIGLSQAGRASHAILPAPWPTGLADDRRPGILPETKTL